MITKYEGKSLYVTSHTMQDSFNRGYSPILFLQGQSALPLDLCQAYMHYANLTRHKR